MRYFNQNTKIKYITEEKPFNKIILALLIISAILGYIASCGKVYLFHIVLMLYMFMYVFGYQKFHIATMAELSGLFFIFFFAIISLLWTPDIVNGMAHIFYLCCGMSIVFIMNNYIRTYVDLIFCFQILSLILLINFFIGLIETTGYFRLPMSLYINELNFDKPSGFNFNLNDFGFIFIIYLPFLLFFPKKIVSILGMLLAIWFAYKLQSKGFFLALLSFICLYIFPYLKHKKYLFLFMGFVVLGIVYSFVGKVGLFQLDGRIFSTFDQISKGVDLLITSNNNVYDSTSERAYLYRIGINSFFESYGLGIGIGGTFSTISALLGKNMPFHFFFLELLIDLGIIPFLTLVAFWGCVILKLKKYSILLKESFLGYLCRAAFYSLLLMPIASISPSSIIYNLSFWSILGFNLAVFFFTKRNMI